MIESLESRQLFAATAHDTLLALRVQWGNLSRPLPGILNRYNVIVGDMETRLVALGVAPRTNTQLFNLHYVFNNTLKTLAKDIKTVKNLLNQDSIHLAKAVALQKAHPNSAAVASVVANAQAALSSQTKAALTVITHDANALLGAVNIYGSTLAGTHPIDTNLTSDATALSSALTIKTAAIIATMSEIVTTAAPNFIAAIVPASTTAA